MRAESWQDTGVESDDDSDNERSTNRIRSNAASDRYERAQPFSANEGQIPLRPPRAPAQLFEGLIRKQEAPKVEAAASEPHIEAPEPVRKTEAFRAPLGGEAAAVVTGEATAEDDDDDEEEDENSSATATKPSDSEPASTWKTEPLPSIEDVDIPAIDFKDTVFDEPPEPARTETAPPDPDFEPIVDTADEPLRRDRGRGGAPPEPPEGPPTEFGAFDREPEPDPDPVAASTPPPASPRWASIPSAPTFEQANSAAINEAEYYAEKRGLRRGLIAGFITGYALKAFLANRKMKRYEAATKKQFAKQNEAIYRSEGEQYRLNEQIAQAKETNDRLQRMQEFAAANQPPAARFERPVGAAPVAEAQPTKPAVEALPTIQEVSEEVRVVDFNGQEVVLQPGQRLERKGWYSVVVDRNGHEVYDVIPRGKAFKLEQKEKLRSDGNAPDSAPAGTATSTAVFAGQTDAPMAELASGQVDIRHELPTGPPPRVDWSHRLPASTPRNPFVAAVKSPWLWAAVAIILIAYFTAALV